MARNRAGGHNDSEPMCASPRLMQSAESPMALAAFVTQA